MTKKELFTKAHKMTKEIKEVYTNVDYKFQLGLCLSYLQEGVIEVVKLEGTEKQIAWAESLKKGFLEMVKDTKENIQEKNSNAKNYYVELKEEVKEITDSSKLVDVKIALNTIMEKVITNIENETSSKKIIDIHQVLKTYGAERIDLIRCFI